MIVAVVAVMSFIVLLAQPSRSAGPPFSNGTLSGMYAYTLSVGNGDVAGTALFDGNGIVSGTLNQYLFSGSPPTLITCSVNWSGTYTVNSNGTFSMIATFTPGSNCGDATKRTFAGAANPSGKTFVIAVVPPSLDVVTGASVPDSGAGTGILL